MTTTKETVQSSVTIMGLEKPSEDVNSAVQAAIAEALGVDASQVVILSSEIVDARRLQVGLLVSFEVVFESETSAVETNTAQSQTMAADSNNSTHLAQSSAGNLVQSSSQIMSSSSQIMSAMESLQQISKNPEIFQKQLTTAFEEQGGAAPALQVQMAQPTVQRVVVRRVPSAWSACHREGGTSSIDDPCAEQRGGQTRNISCARYENPSDFMRDALCQGLPAMPAVRQCMLLARGAGDLCRNISDPPAMQQAAKAAASDAALFGMPAQLMWSASAAALLLPIALCICIWCMRRRVRQRRSSNHVINQAPQNLQRRISSFGVCEAENSEVRDEPNPEGEGKFKDGSLFVDLQHLNSEDSGIHTPTNGMTEVLPCKGTDVDVDALIDECPQAAPAMTRLDFFLKAGNFGDEPIDDPSSDEDMDIDFGDAVGNFLEGIQKVAGGPKTVRKLLAEPASRARKQVLT